MSSRARQSGSSRMRCWAAKTRERTVTTPAGRRNREDYMQIARAAVLAVAILALLGPNAHAQPAPAAWHPVGNVEFFVGAGAGGENDRIARAIQRVLTKEHLVDSMTGVNKPGGAQIIALTDLSRKEGDGNEIGLAYGSVMNDIPRKGRDLEPALST